VSNIRVWATPDKQGTPLDITNGGQYWWESVKSWDITTAPLDTTVWVEGISAGTTRLELRVAAFDGGAQPVGPGSAGSAGSPNNPARP
jgi:hypothetical protein